MSDEPMTREEFAEWLGRWHLSPALEAWADEVYYFPDGAANEVRLLEVTRTLSTSADGPLHAVESTASPLGFPFATKIVEVSRRQWERIQADPSRLPAGWTLSGAKRITPTGLESSPKAVMGGES